MHDAPMAEVPARKLATLADLLAIPEAERRHEIIDGELVQKAITRPMHGRGLTRMSARISDPYDRPPGRRGPGGWWLLADVDIEFAPDQIYRPDLSGFRRERLPTLPDDHPLRLRPDWVCEILSPTNNTHDTVKKFRTYHRCQVPHDWILDPMNQTLTVHRWAEPGYIVLLIAAPGERVRAEPFDAVELDIAAILGDAAEEKAQEPQA
jgi:Uma2 family endonuclease